MGSTQITVVGAGLAGLASAWALQRKGYQVQILEAREGVALETSYANAGMLTPSMADPWNSPGVWRHLLAWLGREQAPMLLRLPALPQYLTWGFRFLRNSLPAAYRRSTLANFALAQLSLAEFRALRASVEWDYSLRTRGTMQVYRHAADLQAARRHLDLLRSLGLEAELLDPAGIATTEPLLAEVAHQFVGGVHFHQDETGNAHLYCVGLAAALQRAGVKFRFDETLQAIRQESGRVVALRTSAGEHAANRVVMATAAHTPALLRSLGLSLPVRPVKGYSLTVPARSGARLPSLAVVDHHHHIALTPFTDQLRLAGSAEFAGWDRRLPPGRLQALWTLLENLLPSQLESYDRQAAIPWCGFRPMAADCVPYIGATPIEGLYLCAGHGHLGWTHSLGSGRLLAELISGETPAIDPRPYRFQRG